MNKVLPNLSCDSDGRWFVSSRHMLFLESRIFAVELS